MLVAGGSTSVITYFAMRLAATGLAATGLTPADFDLQYTRSGAAAAAKVDATLNGNGVGGAWDDNTVIEVDATSSPGLYRIDWPNAAFAAAVREVILTVKVATAFTEHLRVEIDGEVNVVEWGGTDVLAGAIPAAVAGAAGGVAIAGSNAATTFASVSVTGQFDAGNLLIDSTLAVGTTTTLSGAVSLGSTLAITGASTLASLSVTGQLDAGNVVVDAGMDIVGAFSVNSFLVDTTTTLTGNVSFAAAFDVVGELSAGSILVDTTTTLTGVVSAPAGITANITGNFIGTLSTLTTYTGNTPQTADNDILLQAIAGYIDTEITDIQNRLPAALSGGNMKADVLAISTSAGAADKLEESAGTIVLGLAAAGTLSTTEMTTNLTITVNDQYNGRILIFRSDTTTAALRGQATDITDTVTVNGKLTFTALTTAPANGDSFVIV